MDFRSPRARKTVTIGLLAALVTAGVAGVALYQAPDEVRLAFSRGEGFRTLSGHDPSTPEALIEVVERTRDEYVEQMEVLRPFTVVDTTVSVPLLTIKVHVDALGVNHTYIDTGYANITIDGLLSQVPADDVDALIGNLSDEGFTLVDNVTESLPTGSPSPSPSSSPSPSPSPSPSEDPIPVPDPDEPIFLEYTDNGSRILVVAIQPGAERVDVIVYETPGYDGIHITTTPFIVSHQSGDGTLLDLIVRNPIEATVSGFTHPVTVREVECAEGQCVPEAVRDLHDVCTTSQACFDLPRTHITNVTFPGGSLDLPGELLHLWSGDSIHGGAGIGILGNDTTLLAGSRWSGDPFGSGLVLNDKDGALLATLALKLPAPDDPQVGFTLGGPLVHLVAGDDLQHHHELGQYEVRIAWGPLHLGNAEAYRIFDSLNGILVGTWSTTDGTLRGAHITTLANTTELVRVVEEGTGVEVDLDSVRGELIYHGARLEATAIGLVSAVQDAPGPATRAAFDIVNITTGEAEHHLALVEDAIGCNLTTNGCLALVVGPVGDAMEEAGLPRPDGDAPDPEVLLDGLPVDSGEIVLYVNTVAGTVLGYLPASGSAVPCVDTTTPLTCLLSAEPTALAGAAIGFLGDSVPAFSVTADGDSNTIGLYDGSGRAIGAYEGGTLHIAGHAARLGEDPLLTITTPTGRTLCIHHTFDAAEMQDGAWPSVTAGCDGIAGETVVVRPGAKHSFDAQGNLRELALYDPTDPYDHLLYYYDDGESTTLVPHPATGAEPVVLPSTLVHISGNPATSAHYRIDLADESRSGAGVLRGITVYQDAWALTERAGRTYLPGTTANIIFDVTHGPEVDLRVTDGRNARTSGLDGFDGDGWLSGQVANEWLVEAGPDAPERLDLLYRMGDAPHVGGDRVPFSLIGFNDTSGDRVYSAVLDASALAGHQTGGTLHFQLAWSSRHGTVSMTVIDDNDGRDHRYLLDTDAPTASISTPANSTSSGFSVAWSGANETGSGIGTFHVESKNGNGAWEPWIGGRHVSEPQTARFTGQPGTTYTFRAKACDNTGNCGPWSSERSTAVDATAAPPPAQAPAITVLAPNDGATVSGYVALAWSVDHDPTTDPMVSVAFQRSGTSGWTSLYSGHRTSATWDTTNLWDGDHIVRYTVSDGTRSDTETILVHVDNDRPEPKLDLGSGSEGAGGGTLPLDGGADTDDRPDGEKKGSPMVGLPLFALGVLGLLAVLRRRR